MSERNCFRMYQFDRDDASDYSANVPHGSTVGAQNSNSSSKRSITGQSTVRIEKRDEI